MYTVMLCFVDFKSAKAGGGGGGERSLRDTENLHVALPGHFIRHSDIRAHTLWSRSSVLLLH